MKKWMISGPAAIVGTALLGSGAIAVANNMELRDQGGQSVDVPAVNTDGSTTPTATPSTGYTGLSVITVVSTVDPSKVNGSVPLVSINTPQSPNTAVSPVSQPSPVSITSPVSKPSPVSIPSPASKPSPVSKPSPSSPDSAD